MGYIDTAIPDWTPAMRQNVVQRVQTLLATFPNPPTGVDLQACGSRVFGGFDPATSDFDLIAYVQEPGWNVTELRRFQGIKVRLLITSVGNLPRNGQGEPNYDYVYGVGSLIRPQGWRIPRYSLVTGTLYGGNEDVAEWQAFQDRAEQEI